MSWTGRLISIHVFSEGLCFLGFMFHMGLQVAASTQKELDSHIPNYPNLPSWLICLLDNVTLHVQMDRPPFLSTGLSCNFVAFLLSAKHASLQSLACNYQ